MDYGIFFQKLDGLLGLKKMDEAEQYLLDNLKAEMEAEDTQAVLTVMSELIGLYRVTGRGEQSMMISDKSMRIAQSAGMEGTEGYATIVLNAATAYRAAGSLERAEELYAEVVTQLEKAGCKDGYRYASLYNNISILYQETGRYEQAEAELKKALALIKSLPDCKVEEATTYINLALLYIKQGNYDTAEESIKEALAIFDEDKGKKYKDAHYGAALSAYGDLNYKRGNYKAAVSIYEEALTEIARSYGYNNSSYRMTCENCIMAYRALAAVVSEHTTGGTDATVKANITVKTDTTVGKDAAEAAGVAADVSYYEEKAKEHEEFLRKLDDNQGRMKGLELSKRYYDTYVKEMLHRVFPEYEERIAVGLCGHGSECFGFDDEVSEDHDYGPSVCLWLTDEDYEKIGDRLREEYEALPKSFMGVAARHISRNGQNRVGVLRISDFYKEHIGCAKAPDRNDIDAWSSMKQEGAAAAVNGEVFRDDLGEFTKVRKELLAFYPDRLWYALMAESAAKMAQYGQYNYHRCMLRKDYVAAAAAYNGFIRETMELAFLVYREYMPYYKWSYRALRTIAERRQESMLTKLCDGLGKLSELDFHDEESVQPVIEEICGDAVRILKAQGLSGEDDCYMEKQAAAIMSSYDNFLGASTDDRQKLIESIVEAEWNMFQTTNNEGGRADCQNNWNTFQLMRRSQFMAWEDKLLASYLSDLKEGEREGRNLIAEKYARMMESTAPEEYAAIKDKLPVIDKDRKVIAEQVIAIQVGWLEEFRKEYPKLSMQTRYIHTSEDTPWDTSAETYLRGELDTYSEETFILYCRYVIRLYQEGKNLNRMIVENTVRQYGYHSLEDAESRLAQV